MFFWAGYILHCRLFLTQKEGKNLQYVNWKEAEWRIQSQSWFFLYENILRNTMGNNVRVWVGFWAAESSGGASLPRSNWGGMPLRSPPASPPPGGSGAEKKIEEIISQKTMFPPRNG